jgi:hypothetical protein
MTQTPAISPDIQTTIDALPDEHDSFQTMHLLCGEMVRVRPARPRDAGAIQAYMHGLSPASRRNRFLGSVSEVSASELYHMTHADRCSYPALIVESVVEGDRMMISEARYAVAPDKVHCEFAVSVDETWRRKTLATLLVGVVARPARAGAHPCALRLA